MWTKSAHVTKFAVFGGACETMINTKSLRNSFRSPICGKRNFEIFASFIVWFYNYKPIFSNSPKLSQYISHREYINLFPLDISCVTPCVKTISNQTNGEKYDIKPSVRGMSKSRFCNNLTGLNIVNNIVTNFRFEHYYSSKTPTIYFKNLLLNFRRFGYNIACSKVMNKIFWCPQIYDATLWRKVIGVTLWRKVIGIILWCKVMMQFMTPTRFSQRSNDWR